MTLASETERRLAADLEAALRETPAHEHAAGVAAFLARHLIEKRWC